MNPYAFQGIGDKPSTLSNDTEQESKLEYAQPTYDRMGELRLHDYAGAKVYRYSISSVCFSLEDHETALSVLQRHDECLCNWLQDPRPK